jgi:hypothetical protein
MIANIGTLIPAHPVDAACTTIPSWQHLQALNPAAVRTEWQFGELTCCCATKLADTRISAAVLCSVLAASAIPVAAQRRRWAAAIGASIGAIAAVIAAGRPRKTRCKLPIPCQRPRNGHVLLWVIWAEAGSGAPHNAWAAQHRTQRNTERRTTQNLSAL